MAGCMSLEAELTWVHRDQGEDLWDLFTSNNFQMIPDPATGPQPRTRTAATWLAANYFSRIISKYFCPHEGRPRRQIILYVRPLISLLSNSKFL